uniref:Putative nucleic-acid-binding protein from transposon x-element n=1 Tax=Lutzomyia longipalpis TaxID=7200 RepID=A0A1B0CK87_LUTLO
MDNNNESTSDNAGSDWQPVHGKRKGHGSPGTSNQPTKQTRIDEYLPPVSTHNKFGVLTNGSDEGNQDNQQSQSDTTKDADNAVRVPKPPPIVVHDVEDISNLTAILREKIADNYTIKAMKRNDVKIMLNTVDAYRDVLKVLREKKMQLHSYQYKAEKPFRVVVRNLHHSTNVDEIRVALEEKGHSVQLVWNARHRRTKAALPIFFINLAPAVNNKDIYKIDVLLHTKIKVEAPHPRTDVPQCTRCQSYNHTKRYCDRNPRCVKCAGLHFTKDCTRKEKDENVKCVNCLGNHPANYKGCDVYKQIYKKTFPSLRKKDVRPSVNGGEVRGVGESSHVRAGTSYAEAARQGRRQQEQIDQSSDTSGSQPRVSDDMTDLKIMMRQLMEQTSSILNMVTALVSVMSKND